MRVVSPGLPQEITKVIGSAIGSRIRHQVRFLIGMASLKLLAECLLQDIRGKKRRS